MELGAPRIATKFIFPLLVCLGCSKSHAAPATLQNDVFWKDTQGNPIYSQGGGVFKFGNTWYWYGVRYTGAATYFANPTNKVDHGPFVAVTCYSSQDLVNWKFENNVLTPTSMKVYDTTWVGRLGVAYNKNTKMYVLVTQYQGGPLGTGELFATCGTPTGNFTVNNVQTTIANIATGETGDQTVFLDNDGTAYLCASNHSGRGTTYIAPLHPADYLSVDPATKIFSSSSGGREGNCMFRYRDRYYVASSDLHGWNASHSYVISATNILGPYGPEAVIGNTDLDFSHVSQTGLFFRVDGTTDTTVVFAGDRWCDFAGNGIGYNQWVPLTFSGTPLMPVMQSMSQWNLDAGTGAWTVGSGNNWVMNPSIEADRVGQNTVAGWTYSPASTANINSTDARTGNFAIAVTGNATLSQTIEVPNGTYALSVWGESSGGQSVSSLYAKGFGGTEKTASLISVGSNWKQVTIAGIAVSDGSIEVGITSTATTSQWTRADDFGLVRTDLTAVQPTPAQPDRTRTTFKVLGGSTFILPGGASHGEMMVFDLSGKVLMEFHADHAEVRLGEHGLTAPMYLVRFQPD
jgi:hypothetical protein